MENQINEGNQNIQPIEQNPLNQPRQPSEKPKFNYWMFSTLVLAILFVGILGRYIFLAVNKTNPDEPSITPTQSPLANKLTCTQDSDCVIGIQATSCCGCPKAVMKNIIGTKDWELYEFGKDYSPRRSESCGGTVACKPCEFPQIPVCSDGQCKFPGETDGKTDAQKQNAAVFLKLEQSIYEHDYKVFEPVKYTLVNNSSKTVHFLSGCAVGLPEVYKVENGQKTKLQKSGLACKAMPLINQITPGGSLELGWNQQNLGKFVEDGQYQLALEYSFDKSDDFNIGAKLEAISDVFLVRQATWDINKQKQICELYGNEFHSNDFFYSKQDCLANLDF